MKHPKYGDRVVNTCAGDRNPHKFGIFVEVRRYNRRVNGGTWYRLTDGKGDFWEVDPSVIEALNGKEER